MVDARLPDGSRINAIIPPLALDGAVLSIRKFSKTPIDMDKLVGFGSMPAEAAMVLRGVVASRRNVLISGGTGSGKTTMLNAMSASIDGAERIVTIEDSAELQLQQRHVVRLETRPANIEGKGEVAQRELVKNALRMRPDRIILGEIRSGEAFDMLQAMNTGHDGSMTTVHANTARDALSRVEQMIGMSGIDISPKSARAQIASAIHVVLQLERLSDGRRRLTSISEVTGMEGEIVLMQDIFKFERRGVDADGRVLGEFKPTGVRPKFMEALNARGDRHSGAHFRPLPADGGRSMSYFDPRLALYAVVWLATVLIVQGLYSVVSERASAHKRVNKRMRLLQSGVSSEQILSTLRRDTQRASIGFTPPKIADFLDVRLTQAGMTMSVQQLALLMGGATVTIGVLFPILGGISGRLHSPMAVVLLIVFAVVLGIVLPLMLLSRKAAKRIAKFEAQFPWRSTFSSAVCAPVTRCRRRSNCW